jgi:uncharacterized protein YndB with AHSA1/START domain
MNQKALVGVIPLAPVRKQVRVPVNAARAFDAFTRNFDRWWPRANQIGKSPIQRVVLEASAGGRWYEIGEDGTECDWGTVLVWEPPERLVLGWQIGADFKFDAKLLTTVEVRFTPDGNDTIVELEHRDLERMGANASAVRDLFDSAKGWGSVLDLYGRFAAGGN